MPAHPTLRGVMEPPEPYVRAPTLGGSDVGVILGLNPYRTEAALYDQLTGVAAEEPDSADTRRGRWLEPMAAALYEAETGRWLEPAQRIRLATLPIFHATPDRLITYPSHATPGEYAHRAAEDGLGVLEIKCPRLYGFRQAKDEGIAPMYYAQLQHYLALTTLQWGAFAVFSAELAELYYFDVERDQPFIDQMHERCQAWWERHIVAGVRPEERRPDGAGRFWPRARAGTRALVTAMPTWVTAMTMLQRAREAYALAKRQKLLAEGEVKALMGETEEMVVTGLGRVSWRERLTRRIDYGRLRREHPEIDFTAYEVAVVQRIFRPRFQTEPEGPEAADDGDE